MSAFIPVIRAGSPLYLVAGPHRCARCLQETEVVALAARYIWDEEDDLAQDPELDFKACMLTAIVRMPVEILAELLRFHPRCEMRRSPAYQARCLTNRCHCGAWIEPHDIHDFAGGVFSPRCPEEARRLTLRELPFTGYHEFQTIYAWGAGLFTFVWARKLPPGGHAPP